MKFINKEESEKLIKSNKLGCRNKRGVGFLLLLSSHFIMLFSLNAYTLFHVFKTFEMEKKRFENKIRKLRHCLCFTKSKTFSFWSSVKIKNFCTKKYIKLLNVGEGRGRVLITARGGVEGGGVRFFSKKIKRGGRDVYSGSKGRFKTWERKFNPCFKEKPRHKYNLLSISLLVTSKLGMWAEAHA